MPHARQAVRPFCQRTTYTMLYSLSLAELIPVLSQGDITGGAPGRCPGSYSKRASINPMHGHAAAAAFPPRVISHFTTDLPRSLPLGAQNFPTDGRQKFHSAHGQLPS